MGKDTNYNMPSGHREFAMPEVERRAVGRTRKEKAPVALIILLAVLFTIAYAVDHYWLTCKHMTYLCGA